MLLREWRHAVASHDAACHRAGDEWCPPAKKFCDLHISRPPDVDRVVDVQLR